MSYTMTKGANSKSATYTLKHGFDKHVMERVTKKGFFMLPAIVFVVLGLATFTSNQWHGKADKNDGGTPETTLSSNSNEANSGGESDGSRAASWSVAPEPAASTHDGNSISPTRTSGPEVQTTSPISPVQVVGRGGGGETTPDASVPSPVVTDPVTKPSDTLPVLTTPEITPTITDPAPSKPEPDKNLLCTPDLLGVLPETCL
jgi:hypothetical protein